MSEITKLEIWRDTGFTEGAVEVPKISSLTLSNPDITIESGLFPSKNRLFSSVKIEGEWLELYDTSYLRATIELNNPRNFGTEQEQDTIVLYGWIDNVSLVSDNDTRPMTQIAWHIDYWRTFASQAHYGYGMVTRRSKGTDDPIQSVPYLYRLSGDTQLISEGDGLYWVGIACASKDDEHITGTKTYWFPVKKSDLLGNITFKLGSSGTVKTAPSLADVVEGKMDERLGLDPTSISQVFVSPFAPFDYTLNNNVVVFDTGASQGTVTEWTESGDNRYNGKYVISIDSSASTNYKLNYSDGTSTSYLPIQNLPVDSSYNGRYEKVIRHNGSFDVTNFTMTLEDVVKTTLGDTVYNSLPGSSKFRFVNSPDIYFTHDRDVTRPFLWEITDTFTLHQPQQDYTKDQLGSYIITADDVEKLTFHSFIPKESQLYQIETYDKGNYSAMTSKSDYYSEHIITLDQSIRTTDTSECIITDLSGNAVGSLPWGREFSQCNARVVCDSITASIELRFEGIEGKVNGTTFSIPLPHIDLTTNAWSSYNYSGQREYDIRQREMARNQALVEGIAGTVSGSAGNALLGYIGGEHGYKNYASYLKTANKALSDYQYDNKIMGMSPEDENDWISDWSFTNPYKKDTRLRVAGAGFAGGVAGGVIGSAFQWGMQGIFDNKLQSASDTLVSKQSESIASFGNGWDWMWYGRDIAVITLVPDNYSLSRYASDIALNGIIVSEPMSDTDTMIKSAEGPLAVQGLIVTGSIPVQAKYALQNKLATGVRLI